MRPAILTIFSIAFQLVVFAQTVPVQAARNYVNSHGAEILNGFSEFLSLPNVASDTEQGHSDIERNAAYLVKQLQSRGIAAKLLTVNNGFPAVYGEVPTPGAVRTVGFYAHYDGQPVAGQAWMAPPFKATLLTGTLQTGANEVSIADLQDPLPPSSSEWRIYARSSGDDKGTIQAFLSALDALKASRIHPSVNLKFIFEGEEEAGSPHLSALLNKHADLLKADLWLLCDGPKYQNGQLQLVYGVRGVMGLEVTTFGPKRALHSGHYGNWAPNPAVELAHLIAAMRDVDGHILIPHFYDSVKPITKAEQKALESMPDLDRQLVRELALTRTEGNGKKLKALVLEPALNVRGVRAGDVGAAAANAVMSQAVASIDFRLVPDQTPELVQVQVESFLRGLGYFVVHDLPSDEVRGSHQELVMLKWEQGYPASRTPLDSPEATAVADALREIVGENHLIRTPSLGGSVPMYLFQQEFNAPVLILPIANYDNNQHDANENLRLQNLWDGIEIYTALFANLGHH